MDRVRDEQQTEREREREQESKRAREQEKPLSRLHALFRGLSGAIVFVLMGLVPCPTGAAEFCRLTFSSPGPLIVNDITTVQVRVDHDQLEPSPQAGAGSLAIRAFSAGIEIPEGVILVGADFSGTVVEEALGPLTAQFCAIHEVPGGVIVTAFLSGDLGTVIPAGVWQPLVNLHLQALSGAPVGGVATLQFRDDLPGQRHPTVISLVRGEVRPRTRALSLPVLPAPPMPTGTPPVAQGYPEPTPAELGLDFLRPPAPVPGASGGGSTARGGGTGNCSFVTAQGDPAASLSTGLNCTDLQVACVPLEFPSSQAALDFYPVTPGLPPNDYTVLVSDGQYPPFTVDLFNFLSGGSTLNLTIISENGPESTIIQSDGTEPAITVIRTPLATAVDTVVRIGWTELSIPFAPWFCPPEDFQPDRQGWRGFTITGGEATSPPGTILDLGAGIQLLDVFGSIEIRGNIIDDNGDQGTFQGGAIAAMNCRDVLIALNEISNNNAVELGAGIFLTDSRAIVAENFIHHNSIIDNPVVITGFGGGLCSERSDVEVCGNMIFANTAGNAGGGVWLGTFFNGQPLFGEVWLMHNTITSNVLTEGQDGTGILIPFDSDLGYALVFGDGNIVYHNTAELSPFGSEWFAQCGPSGSVPPPGNQFWSFSQMQNLFPGFTCLTGDTNYDLFDGTVPDDTAPPLIVNTKDPHLGDSTSPCVDRGNPGFQASTFP
ncbi:MAG: right-handed parallel beta-helix repeat-containing protein, partial [Planctomycetota bacterium]